MLQNGRFGDGKKIVFFLILICIPDKLIYISNESMLIMCLYFGFLPH